MKEVPIVSVIIPVYNGAETLTSCLQSIFENFNDEFEVIVSDDASTDNSIEIAKKYSATVLVSHHSNPRGAATARNIAARKAKGKILFFTDADVILQPNAINFLISLFNKNPNVNAFIGSYTYNTPIENFYSKFKNFLHHYTHQHSEDEAITFWTACGGIYRDTFLKINGFNEAYNTASVEDIAFGYKLSKAGYQIRLEKKLLVTHLKEYSFRSLVHSDIAQRAIPWTRLMLREKTFRSDLNTSITNAIGLVVAYLMLFTLISCPFSTIFLYLFLVLTLLFLVLNSPLYISVYKYYSLIFSIKFIVMSYLYYLYSGMGFIIGTLGYFLFGRKY